MSHSRRHAPLLLAFTLVGAAALGAAWGCGGAAGTAMEGDRMVEPEREDPTALESEQRELDEALSEVLARPEPDCARACELVEAICDLSERICGIAERHPADAATADRCRDGAARCDAARERAEERCTCAAP